LKRTLEMKSLGYKLAGAWLLAIVSVASAAQSVPAQSEQSAQSQQSSPDSSVTYTPIAPEHVPGRAPSVTMAPVALVTAKRGTETIVNLNFRVLAGYHINSATPKSEFLIPTTLKMDLPTDIVLGKIAYPPGQDLTFPFSPDEALSVYTGEFTVAVAVHPLHAVVAGKYVMHGVLRYQACDNAQCFPPKTVPVSFEVKVVKEPAGPVHHPPQSPALR
jgi:hypothetical protein